MNGIRPRDTSEEAWRVYLEAQARLGPEGRLEASFEAAELGVGDLLEEVLKESDEIRGRA